MDTSKNELAMARIRLVELSAVLGVINKKIKDIHDRHVTVSLKAEGKLKEKREYIQASITALQARVTDITNDARRSDGL